MMYAKFFVFRNFSVLDKHHFRAGESCAVDGLENWSVCLYD